jgi:Domain of unknown function (DUF1707)
MMAGPGDGMAAGAERHQRASRADREQVIDVLKAAFVQERLTRDEFDQRIGQALASRTYADLDALTADIPGGLTAAEPGGRPAGVLPPKAAARVTAAATGVSMVFTAVEIAESSGGNAVVGLVAVGAVGWFVAMLVAGLLMFLSWAVKHSGRQHSPGAPPSAGSERSPRRSPSGRLLPPPRDPRHTAQAAAKARPCPAPSY